MLTQAGVAETGTVFLMGGLQRSKRRFATLTANVCTSNKRSSVKKIGMAQLHDEDPFSSLGLPD
jgi:hypothetical protein